MDLDGHKSVIMSLNIIGKHLAEHTRDMRRAEKVKMRLDAANCRWEAVCTAATKWQAKLQNVLMGNSEFHTTISELLTWTESTEETLKEMAVDDDVDESVLRDRVYRILDIRAEVERCEPRVASLHQAAHHLLEPQDDATCKSVRENLALLSRRLQLLLVLCTQRLTILSQRLGQDYTQSLTSLASSGVSLLFLKFY